MNASHYETRVATLEDGEIRQLHIEREEDRNVVGNIYKGVVKRVLPGMQAAFLELGLERTAFLYVDDIIDEPFGTDFEVIEEEETEPGEEQEDSAFDPENYRYEEKKPAAPRGRGRTARGPERDSEDKEGGEGEADRRPAARRGGGREVEGDRDQEQDTDRDRDYDRDYDDREDRDRDYDEDRDHDHDRGPRHDEDDYDRDGDRGPDREPVREREPERNRPPAQGRGRGPAPSRNPRSDRPRDEGRSEGREDEGDRDRDETDNDDDGRGNRGGPKPQRGRQVRGRSPRGSSSAGGGGGGRRPQGRGGRPGGRGRFSNRRPRGSANIQDLLKEGQEILVQVAKAPIGTKGARLTTHISLPGRNLVLMPTVKHLGISRRISNERERRRLRDIFTKKIRPKDVGFIIRTVADGKSYRDIRADADYLIRSWDQINQDSKTKRAPALIHEDLSLGMRAVRDFFTEDVDSFIIDNPEEYENVLDFVTEFMPKLKSRVKLFKGPSQLFEHYGIEAEISRALGKKVWLKSGGYLLIDQSEALTAIDVNTGRYVGTKSLEETILKTNLEAVKEVAYQLRIRNVGGIIIIDLIDMENLENREKVYRALSEALGEDRAKTNILKISELGLVEMTRKRTHEDLVRYLTEACAACDGRGYHKSRRTVCFEIFREIEKEGASNNKNIMVFAHPNVVTRMIREEQEHVKLLEKRFDKNIIVKIDPDFHMEQYEVYGRA